MFDKEIQQQLADMNTKKGELTQGWSRYLNALNEAGLAGIDGIQQQHDEMVALQKRAEAEVKKLEKSAKECRGGLPKIQRAASSAEALLTQCNEALAKLTDLKKSYGVFESYFGDVDPLATDHPSTTFKKVNQRNQAADTDFNNASAEFSTLSGLNAAAIRFEDIFGAGANALTLTPLIDHRRWTEREGLAQQSLLPLEPYVTALESFTVKFPGHSPSAWIDATDSRRAELEGKNRDVEGALTTTKLEIGALDRLAVVDDAAFGRAWKVLGDGPQRLYAMLQSMEGTAERRVGALSAMTGLLSAPVFDTVENLAVAAELLESHGIGIPL